MAITSCFIGAPQDCPKFQRLYRLLASNDLTTAVVETWRESTPFGYGESLGAALQNNTVVSELFLQLSYLLDEQEMVAGTAERVSRLLHFLEDSPTLQSLRLACVKINTRGRFMSPTSTDIRLLELILNAALQNPVIRLLDLEFHELPLPMLIRQLSSAQPRLAAFCLYFRQDANSDAVAIETAAAQIFELLPTIQELTLNVHPISPFLSTLTQCTALRHLSIALTMFRKTMLRRPGYHCTELTAADIAALCGVLFCRESSLQHLSMESIKFTAVQWKDIALALEGNPQLHMLTLKRCNLDKVPQFACPDPLALGHPLENIRTLELLGCQWSDKSQWQHGVCFPNLSDYLPFTARLHSLTLQVHTSDEACQLHVHVSADFLIALRQNGSLREVSLSARFPDRLPLPHVVRYIQAITERNLQLSQILGRTANTGNSGQSGGSNNEGADEACRSRRILLFPKIFCVARQAQRTAPNTLFLGLLSTSYDEIGPIALHRKRRIK
jgi:hypothetical protein